MKVNALPITKSGKPLQCYECHQWGHKKTDYPSKGTRQANPRPGLPFQKGVFQNRNRSQPKRANCSQPKNVTINLVSVKDEIEEQAQIYATLDPSGYNRQYSILEAQGDYEGKPLSLLIDSDSLHSFISPSTAKRLQVEALPTTGRKLRASLANGSSIITEE